jgi:hypothetical protein
LLGHKPFRRTNFYSRTHDRTAGYAKGVAKVPPSYAGDELASALRSIVGDKYFLDEPTAMIPYVRDSGIFEGGSP